MFALVACRCLELLIFKSDVCCMINIDQLAHLLHFHVQDVVLINFEPVERARDGLQHRPMICYFFVSCQVVNDRLVLMQSRLLMSNFPLRSAMQVSLPVSNEKGCKKRLVVQPLQCPCDNCL